MAPPRPAEREYDGVGLPLTQARIGRPRSPQFRRQRVWIPLVREIVRG
jgi:hypothetical protein